MSRGAKPRSDTLLPPENRQRDFSDSSPASGSPAGLLGRFSIAFVFPALSSLPPEADFKLRHFLSFLSVPLFPLFCSPLSLFCLSSYILSFVLSLSPTPPSHVFLSVFKPVCPSVSFFLSLSLSPSVTLSLFFSLIPSAPGLVPLCLHASLPLCPSLSTSCLSPSIHLIQPLPVRRHKPIHPRHSQVSVGNHKVP